MMSKRVQRVAIAPPGSSLNIGWRTNVDVKAGKNIRIDEDGFENFSDYFTSPETEHASSDSLSHSDAAVTTGCTRRQTLTTVSSMSSFTPLTNNENTSSEDTAIKSVESAAIPVSAKIPVEPTPDVCADRKADDACFTHILLNQPPQMVAGSPEQFGTRKRLIYSLSPDHVISAAAERRVLKSTSAVTNFDAAAADQEDHNRNTQSICGKHIPYELGSVELPKHDEKTPVDCRSTRIELLCNTKQANCTPSRSVRPTESEQALGMLPSNAGEAVRTGSVHSADGVDVDEVTATYNQRLKAALSSLEDCSVAEKTNKDEMSDVEPDEQSNSQLGSPCRPVTVAVEVVSHCQSAPVVGDDAQPDACDDEFEILGFEEVECKSVRGGLSAVARKNFGQSVAAGGSVVRRQRRKATESAKLQEDVCCTAAVTDRDVNIGASSALAVASDFQPKADVRVKKPRKSGENCKKTRSEGASVTCGSSRTMKKVKSSDAGKEAKKKSKKTVNSAVVTSDSRDLKSTSIYDIERYDEEENLNGMRGSTVVKDQRNSAILKSFEVVNEVNGLKRASKRTKKNETTEKPTDVFTLPSVRGFCSSSFITSTPLPSHRHSAVQKSSPVQDLLITRMSTSVRKRSLNGDSSAAELSKKTACNAIDAAVLAVKEPTTRPRSSNSSATTVKGGKRRQIELSRSEGIPEERATLGVTFADVEPDSDTGRSLSPEFRRNGTTDACTDGRRSSSLLRYSTASPLHYFEVTNHLSDTAKRRQQKIVVPDETETNLRRSSRTRVRTLEWFRGERIQYKRRQSGYVVAGIHSPKIDENKERAKRLRLEIRKHLNKEKKVKSKRSSPKTPRNLSIHVGLPEGLEPSSEPEIPVFSREANAEVLMECIKNRDQFNHLNSSGKPATADDPLTFCKPLRHKSFCGGFVTIRPLKSKQLQHVKNDTMVFCVIRGKLELTLHRTQQIIEANDTFFVPPGNNYSLRNMRNDEAKLFFVQLKNRSNVSS